MITYAFFSVAELPKVDFDRVNETAVDTLRYSLDGSMIFVHWNESQPEFLSNIECEIVTSDEALQILEGNDWINNNDWLKELERLNQMETNNENE